MPLLKLKDSGREVLVASENIQEALASGLYNLPSPDYPIAIETNSGLVEVPFSDLGRYQQLAGGTAASESSLAQGARSARIDREHGGFAGAVGAFAEGAVDAATLGAYGAATDAILGDEYTRNRAERKEANPGSSTAGSVTGVVSSALVNPASALGKVLPAAKLAQGASKIAAAGDELGVLGKAAFAGLGYGTEGAILGAAHVVSETILEDKELSGEAILASAKDGALMGALFGVGGSLFSSGATAAKKAIEKRFYEQGEVAVLAKQQKEAAKEAAKAQKETERLARKAADERIKLETFAKKNALEIDKYKQRAALEIEKQSAKGQLSVETQRAKGSAALEKYQARSAIDIEKATAKQKLANQAADNKLLTEQAKLETYQAKATVAKNKIEAEYIRLEQTANRAKADMAKAEARAAVAKSKVDVVSERLSIEQERTRRVIAEMKGRATIAETYKSRSEIVAAGKTDTATINQGTSRIIREGEENVAKIKADADIRTELGDALARATTDDATKSIRELIPARMRTPGAEARVRQEMFGEMERLASNSNDLARIGDEITTIDPNIGRSLQASQARMRATAENLNRTLERMKNGADDFQEVSKAIREADEARTVFAQEALPHVEAINPQMAAKIADDIAPSIGAIEKQTDALADSVLRPIEVGEAAAKRAGGGVIADAAGFASLLQDAGINVIPNVDDIPVIGKPLGAYLKFRALRAGGLRIGGPIGRLAGMASGTQNRGTEAIQRLVGAANTLEKASKTLASTAPSAAVIMSKQLWDAGETPKPKRGEEEKPDIKQQFQQRANELVAAVSNPDIVRDTVDNNIPAPAPLRQSIADVILRKLDYLHSVMPKDPREGQLIPEPYEPSPMELQDFARVVGALDDPMSVVERSLSGDGVLPAEVDAIKAVYPRLYQQIREELVEAIVEKRPRLSREMKFSLSITYDIPLDPTASPEFIAARQSSFAAAFENPQPEAGALSAGIGGLIEQNQLGIYRQSR